MVNFLNNIRVAIMNIKGVQITNNEFDQELVNSSASVSHRSATNKILHQYTSLSLSLNAYSIVTPSTAIGF